MDSGVRPTSVGLMASCASCTVAPALAALGPPTYFSPNWSLTNPLAFVSASAEMRVESVRI